MKPIKNTLVCAMLALAFGIPAQAAGDMAGQYIDALPRKKMAHGARGHRRAARSFVIPNSFTSPRPCAP